MKLTARAVDQMAARQGGVMTTRELIRLGADHSWITRQVDSGRWQRLHRGVLLTHSGPVPWLSSAFAALLYAGRHATLSHEAAAHLHGMTPRAPQIIDVTVPESRRVMASTNLLIHYRTTMPPMTEWPLRTALPDTALDLVATATSADDVLGWLSGAVRAGATPAQLRRRLERRPWLRNIALARELLAEVAEGIESPLEGRYHRDVERAHGLPAAELQVREVIGGSWIRADRVYRGYQLRVELDGALAHPRGRTNRDTWRDNATLLQSADRTLRYRWFHVSITPCRTTQQVVAGLRLVDPALRVDPCGPTCPVR